MPITYRETREIEPDSILALYQANRWSSANVPDRLCAALRNSHALVSAWDGARLVGLGNALSDGALVAYYPHLLVLPEYQGRGIGREILRLLMARYQGVHQQILVADPAAVGFYERCGFRRAGATEPMWSYRGDGAG